MKEKKDNSTLFGCGGLVIGTMVLSVIALVISLIFGGKRAAIKMINDEDDNILSILRGGLILLVILGVIYLVINKSKD